MPLSILAKAAASILCIGLLSTFPAHAETLIKRIKCNDALNATPLQPGVSHQNSTGTEVKITVQVVRDACRPRGDTSGYFTLAVTNGSGLSQVALSRAGKVTSSMTRILPSGYYGYLRFIPVGGGSVSGTFDYVYTIH